MRLLVGLVLLVGCRQDRDGDGFVGRDDCDDHDPSVFPGADERCNGADDDCDGQVDEVADLAPRFVDQDGDGFGSGPELRECPDPEGTVAVGGDCDDRDADVHPGAPEACDGVDQDCDGRVDEDPEPPLYVDADADGFGDPAQAVGCVAFAVANTGDCDDSDDQVFPGAPERCNGRDDDCDGHTTGEEDEDGDGAWACVDCDDGDGARSPDVLEVCDGIDDDCDGEVDGDNAWWSTDGLARVRVVVDAEAGSTAPLVLALDARAVLDAVGQLAPFDPDRLRAAWQGCDGMVELPVAWVEDEAWALGGRDDLSEVGAVVVLYDRDGDLDTVEGWPGDGEVGLYLGVEDGGVWDGGVVRDGDTLGAGGLDLVLHPEAGGLGELVDGGVVRWSQAEALAGNGIRTSGGPLAAQDVAGTVSVADLGPVTAALTASVSMSNSRGGLDATWGYRRFAGRSEVWVAPRFTTTRTTTLSGLDERTETVRPFQVRLPAHSGLVASEDLVHVRVEAPVPVGWSWAVPPLYLTHVGEDTATEQAWSSANDVAPCCGGSTGSVGSGVELLVGPVLRVDLGEVGALPVGVLQAPEGL